MCYKFLINILLGKLKNLYTFFNKLSKKVKVFCFMLIYILFIKFVCIFFSINISLNFTMLTKLIFYGVIVFICIFNGFGGIKKFINILILSPFKYLNKTLINSFKIFINVSSPAVKVFVYFRKLNLSKFWLVKNKIIKKRTNYILVRKNLNFLGFKNLYYKIIKKFK